MSAADSIFTSLEDAFLTTFPAELIPGILYNFANPLNGIMGRSQILQRRFDNLMGILEKECPAAVVSNSDLLHRLKTDVGVINAESDRFYGMFQQVSEKFLTLQRTAAEQLSLSRLLAQELHFAEYYLEFKHEIHREIQLDEDLPAIVASPAQCSLAVWAILRYMTVRLKLQENKRLSVATSFDEGSVFAIFRCQLPAGTSEQDGTDRLLQQALDLLRLNGISPDLQVLEDGWMSLVLKAAR